MTCTTAMTDSTLTMIEPCPSGNNINNHHSGAEVTGPTHTSLLVPTTVAAAVAARSSSLRLKPCLSSTGSGGPRTTVGLEMVTMRTAPWRGSSQVLLLKKDSVRSRNSYVCEL